jgi:hypothetical protein
MKTSADRANRRDTVNEYRVTKYDPALRDERGAFTRNEWTSIKDVGSSFDGIVLTEERYTEVERAYVEAAVAFLDEAGVARLKVENLESPRVNNLEFSDGQILSVDRLPHVLRRLLRGEFWCRLQGDETFVHVAWDYYMFIGVPIPCPSARAFATKLGLFVEDFLSPYKDLD